MNYTLNQLQIFLKVTQTGSVTKAAEELNLTQPAVSIQLKNFQDQFEIPLTEVIGRKLYVTDFGKEIALATEKILNEVYAINYKTLAFKGQLTGRLKIAVVSTGKYVIPYFLTHFINQHEGIELLLDVTNKAKVLDSLAQNGIDFALVSVLPNNIAIEKEELLQNKLYLVSNKQSITNSNSLLQDFVQNTRLIYREEGSGTRFVMQQYFERNNLQIKKKLELTSSEAVKQAVIAGLGCSIMPLIGIKNELMNGDLHIIPTKGLPIKSSWNLIWLKNKNFSPIATAFLDYVRKEKSQIIKEHFDWYESY